MEDRTSPLGGLDGAVRELWPGRRSVSPVVSSGKDGSGIFKKLTVVTHKADGGSPRFAPAGPILLHPLRDVLPFLGTHGLASATLPAA